ARIFHHGSMIFVIGRIRVNGGVRSNQRVSACPERRSRSPGPAPRNRPRWRSALRRPGPARHKRRSPRRKYDHRLCPSWERRATKPDRSSRLARQPFPASGNSVPAVSKWSAATNDAVAGDESGRHTSRVTPAPLRTSWPERRVGYRFRWRRPHGVHATRIPLQSCSSYPGEKRAPHLNGIAGTFFAQTLSGALHGVRRKVRSVVGRDRHEQSSLPLELHFQWSRCNGDGAFFPTNLERHSRLDAGLAANVFRDHQPTGMINGGFHGISFTIWIPVGQAALSRSSTLIIQFRSRLTAPRRASPATRPACARWF